MSIDASTGGFLTLIIDGRVHTKIVPQQYVMDPDHEVLLSSGELEDGMIVLTELGREDEALANDRVAIRNRWCRVKRITKKPDSVYFIGDYGFNDKMIRQAAYTSKWYVKKNSIPQ